MGDHGWTFDQAPGVVPDPVGKAHYLYEVYLRAVPEYSGRVTVPVLWDLQRNTIVNNESGEIIRMLNSAFDGVGATREDFAPAALLPQIDEINARVYHDVNNGVYKAGFATDQQVYENAVGVLFRMPGRPRSASVTSALSYGRSCHRSRLAAFHHAGSL